MNSAKERRREGTIVFADGLSAAEWLSQRPLLAWKITFLSEPLNPSLGGLFFFQPH